MVVGMEAIFEAGYREFARLRQQHKAIDARSQLESAQRAMRATLARELDRLEHNLELLANVGSTAPYDWATTPRGFAACSCSHDRARRRGRSRTRSRWANGA